MLLLYYDVFFFLPSYKFMSSCCVLFSRILFFETSCDKNFPLAALLHFFIGLSCLEMVRKARWDPIFAEE